MVSKKLEPKIAAVKELLGYKDRSKRGGREGRREADRQRDREADRQCNILTYTVRFKERVTRELNFSSSLKRVSRDHSLISSLKEKVSRDRSLNPSL